MSMPYFFRVKILAFSFYFPPHGGPGAIRPLKMLEYAAKLGAEGGVVCAAEGDYPVRDESLSAEVPPEFMVLRTPDDTDPFRAIRRRKGETIHAPKSDFFFLPDNKIWWVKSAAHLGVIAMPDADVVWATCPPYSAALAARRAAKELDVPLVLDFRDSWTKNPNRPKLPAPHRAINRALARKAARASSLITCVYDAIADEMRELAPKVRIELLPNGFDPADMPAKSAPSSADGPLHLFYLGTIYPGLNYPLPLLEAMSDVDDVTLSVIGRYPEIFEADIERLGLQKRVHLEGYLPHREALERAAAGDAMLLYIDARPLNAGQITSKTYEYMGLGKPILACIPSNGEAAALLEDYSAATIVQTDDRAAIADALRSLIEMKRTSSLPDSAPPDRFSRRAIAEKWYSLLDEVVEF